MSIGTPFDSIQREALFHCLNKKDRFALAGWTGLPVNAVEYHDHAQVDLAADFTEPASQERRPPSRPAYLFGKSGTDLISLHIGDARVINKHNDSHHLNELE